MSFAGREIEHSDRTPVNESNVSITPGDVHGCLFQRLGSGDDYDLELGPRSEEVPKYS
jgi:hypothetical protein